MATIKRMCADDREVLDLIDQAVQREHGGDRRSEEIKSDNVTLEDPKPDGNSRQRALRHLREKRPDLHSRVLADELSPHAAMIEAGFRPKTITIPDDPEKAARTLLRHFQGDRRDSLLAEGLTPPSLPMRRASASLPGTSRPS